MISPGWVWVGSGGVEANEKVVCNEINGMTPNSVTTLSVDDLIERTKFPKICDKEMKTFHNNILKTFNCLHKCQEEIHDVDTTNVCAGTCFQSK